MSPLFPTFPFDLRSLSNGKGLELHLCLAHNGFHGYRGQHFNIYLALPKCIISLLIYFFYIASTTLTE